MIKTRAYKNFGFFPSLTGKQTKGMLVERSPILFVEEFSIRVIERALLVERFPTRHASKS